MHYYSQFTRSQFTWTIILAFNFPHLFSTSFAPAEECYSAENRRHVVFADNQSSSFRTAIPQSILRITQFRKT